MAAAKNMVIIGPAHPLRGGLATYNERLARELMAEGHHVTIYTFSYQYPGFLFPGTTQYSSEPAPGDLTIRQKINSVNPVNWWRVGNELKRLRPDVIVVRYWLPFMGPALGTILRRVKKNRHTRVVCIADNIIPHEARPGDKAFTRYFIRPIDAFITMSEKVLADLRAIAPAKPATFVAHPLYDNFGPRMPQLAARAHLGITGDVHILLFFGFIRKYKGLDILLKAFRLLVQDYGVHNLRLLIAGEFYEDRSHYDALLDDPVIAPYLLLHTHFISDSEVKYYLNAADCVIQPYRSATQSGVTPLAYHFEVPMIVTNVGGLPALVPDGVAGLVASPNPESIAAKIVEYFTRGRDHFLRGLRLEKEKYSWSHMTRAILERGLG